ncbi:MAG: hypothetical protein H6852_01175 [Geminicoccaceae bacterium]|nr:hypothetical protein [Geminicoccaceae bacterium]
MPFFERITKYQYCATRGWMAGAVWLPFRLCHAANVALIPVQHPKRDLHGGEADYNDPRADPPRWPRAALKAFDAAAALIADAEVSVILLGWGVVVMSDGVGEVIRLAEHLQPANNTYPCQ